MERQITPVERVAIQRLLDRLRARLSFDDCLLLALEERGAQSGPGAAYGEQDFERAKQIFEKCFRRE